MRDVYTEYEQQQGDGPLIPYILGFTAATWRSTNVAEQIRKLVHNLRGRGKLNCKKLPSTTNSPVGQIDEEPQYLSNTRKETPKDRTKSLLSQGAARIRGAEHGASRDFMYDVARAHLILR